MLSLPDFAIYKPLLIRLYTSTTPSCKQSTSLTSDSLQPKRGMTGGMLQLPVLVHKRLFTLSFLDFASLQLH